MILSLEPILVMLGSFWLFKQRTTLAALAGIVIAIFGVLLIGWGDLRLSGQALYGDLLSVLGTVAVAVHIHLHERAWGTGRSQPAGLDSARRDDGVAPGIRLRPARCRRMDIPPIRPA